MASAISFDNLRRILLLRSTLLVASLAMALMAHPLFHVLPRLDLLLAVCAVWLVLMVAAWRRARVKPATSDVRLLAYLATDIVLLTAFLIYCGGIANPLTAFYLMPVAAAAALLPTRLAWLTAAAAILAYSLLWFAAVPLVVEDVDQAMQMHLAGMWLTFGMSALLLASVVGRMGSSLRERDRRLAAARERTLRDERMVALGGLAAGAAHRLGTPLNTLTLLADEIAVAAPHGSELAGDVAELRSQLLRCKDIVRDLLIESGIVQGGELPQPLSAWVAQVVHNFRQLRPECAPSIEIDPQLDQRLLRPDAALAQALTDLLDNAADASPGDVRLTIEPVGQQGSRFRIQDAGRGFSSLALEHAGLEPYSEKTQGMGLGLYLARACVERMGGSFLCRNLPGGAEVAFELPSASFAP